MFGKLVMTTSGILLLLWGLALIFLPKEVLTYNNLFPFKPLQLMLSLLGAYSFSLGLMNWLYRKNPIGGIYQRPVVVANLSHFFIAGMALLQALMTGRYLPPLAWIVAFVNIGYAVCFCILLFNPSFGNRK